MFLILVLSTLSSSSDISFAESLPENFEPTPKIKTFTVDLSEKIGITEIKKQIQNVNVHHVTLEEKIGMTSQSINKEIILIKHDSDRKLMMERIFDRQSKIKENKISQLFSVSSPIYHEQNLIDNFIDLDVDVYFDQLNLGINNFDLTIFDTEIIITEINYVIPNIFDQINVISFDNEIFDPKNPTLLIFLIPFAGFVFLRYDNEQIKFHQLKQFFTFIFVVILVSSAAITPMSISSSYWGSYAFGEIDNSTEIISPLEIPEFVSDNNSTTISESNENIIPELILETISPESYLTKPNIEMSLSDILDVTLTTFVDVDTIINYSDSFTSDAQMSFSDVLSVTLSGLTNDTTTNYFVPDAQMSFSDVLSVELIGNTTSTASDSFTSDAQMSFSDNLEIIFTPGFSINEATIGLTFDSLDNTIASDGAQINDENSLQLDGDHDFIQLNDSSTNTLRSLVIGTWVKPDYSQGSPEFTVVSKEKSFSLVVDNQISSNKAKFSIFDGIQWTEIISDTEIPESWTHLIASFSNQTVSIYVNGNLAGTKQIEAIPSISLEGQLESVNVETISSESDIVVGAYITTKGGVPTPTNMFSGVIDDVALFDYILSDIEISQLYTSGIATHGLTQTKSLMIFSKK